MIPQQSFLPSGQKIQSGGVIATPLANFNPSAQQQQGRFKSALKRSSSCSEITDDINEVLSPTKKDNSRNRRSRKRLRKLQDAFSALSFSQTNSNSTATIPIRRLRRTSAGSEELVYLDPHQDGRTFYDEDDDDDDDDDSASMGDDDSESDKREASAVANPILPPILKKDKEAHKMSAVDRRIEEIIRQSCAQAERQKNNLLLNNKGKLIAAYSQDDFRLSTSSNNNSINNHYFGGEKPLLQRHRSNSFSDYGNSSGDERMMMD